MFEHVFNCAKLLKKNLASHRLEGDQNLYNIAIYFDSKSVVCAFLVSVDYIKLQKKNISKPQPQISRELQSL